MMVVTFDRAGLEHAAAAAAQLYLDSKSHSKYSTPAIGANPSAAMTPR
jgi:hypothetical protein